MATISKFGVQGKLAFWLLLVLVPVVIGGAASLYTINLRLSERIEADLMNTRRLEAARITEALENYQDDVESLAAGRHVIDFVSKTSQYRLGTLEDGELIAGYDGFDIVDPASDAPLQQLVDELDNKARSVGSEVVELQLLDVQGNSLGYTAGFAWKPYQPDIAVNAIAREKTLFGNAFRAQDGEHRMGMVTPIFGMDRRVVGALLVEMRLEPIVGLVVAHEGFGETSESHIAQPTPEGDAEFITLLRFKRQAAFNKIVPKSKNLPINWSLESPGGRLVRSPDYRSIDSILAIETLAETGWGLVVKIDAVEAFQPVAEVQRIVLVTTAVLMLTVVLGWILFLRPLGQRMQRLSRAADRIAGGDLHAVIGDPSIDEIGTTSRSIDTLAKDLLEDIARRSEVEQQLKYQAHHDELTGLFNRKRGNELIELLDEKRAEIKHRAVLFLDLNGFKAINDVYGHDVGDQILIAVAKRLKETVGSNSSLIRWGGDEFVIVAVGEDAENIQDMIDTLNQIFSQPFVLPSGAHSVGCSIGLSCAQDGNCKLDDVLVEADARMYENKQSRKTSRGALSESDHLVLDAIKEARLHACYQPILSVDQQGQVELVSAEALVRIVTVEGSRLMPADFMPQLTRTDTLVSMDIVVMQQTLNNLKQWVSKGLVSEKFTVALNISQALARSDQYAKALEGTLRGLQLAASRVCIELCDDIKPSDYEFISRLQGIGVKIALDNFGVSRSNLDRMSDLKPDIVKIDKRWVKQAYAVDSEQAHEHMNLLVDLCQSLGVAVVIEGVERQDQLSGLLKIGPATVQGYYFSEAVNGDELLDSWKSSVSYPSSTQSIGPRAA